jgi:hypothetical protein
MILRLMRFGSWLCIHVLMTYESEALSTQTFGCPGQVDFRLHVFIRRTDGHRQWIRGVFSKYVNAFIVRYD